jgi:ABC-type branched-subunit amino acid transport system ATPase component
MALQIADCGYVLKSGAVVRQGSSADPNRA